LKAFISIFILTAGIFIAKAQEKQVDVVSFEHFKSVLQKENDTLYLINFWATWCKPCVAELPYFEQINQEYSDKKLKVILVSLDFTDELETRLLPFLETRNIQSKVYLLNESNPNSYIDQINPQWSGAIPATLIYKGKDKFFYEQNFTYQELVSIINQKIQE
jgi:thiol-disulfide isomerase/thioredoxin